MATKPTTSLPVGTVWEIPGGQGKPVTISRPDNTVAVVSDALHVLSLPGEYVARVGRTTITVEALHADAS